MKPLHTISIILFVYFSSVVFYSRLFIFTQNQSNAEQFLKILVAGLHSLVFIIPVYMCQSRWALAKILGYFIFLLYFVFVFFISGYFSYFGFIPELYAFGTGNISDLLEVTGHYFAQVFGWSEVLLLGIAGAFLLVLPRARFPGWAALVLVLPASLFAYSAVTFGSPFVSNALGNASVVKRFGIPTYAYVSVSEWAAFESGYLSPDTPNPGKVSDLIFPGAPVRGKIAALPEGVDRVVLIQIESFDKEAISATRNGVAIMPFVSNLRPKCLEYDNFFTTKSVGGSSDAEFSIATGLVPSARRPSIRHVDFGRIDTVYDLLREQGIASYFAHNNHIGFYGRHAAYSQIEGLNVRFLDLNRKVDERAFALETLQEAIETSDRFFYYFFNFQSHGPFTGYTEDTAARLSVRDRSDIHVNYLATMHEVDQTIADMFALQAAEFESGKTLFILTADHPSYLHTGADLVARANIPMLICHAGLQGQVVAKVGSSPDVFPTILDVFAAPAAQPPIGQSLFDDAENVALFPGRSVLFRGEDGKLVADGCNGQCEKFFDFTNQHIKVSE